MKTTFKSYGKSLAIFLIFMLLNLLISFSLQALFYYNQIKEIHFKLLLSLTFIIPITAIYTIFFRNAKINFYFYKNIIFYIIIFPLLISIQIIGTTIELWSFAFIPEYYVYYYERIKELLYPKNHLDLVVSILTIGILAPICEELLFREFILNYMLQYNRFIFSNIFQSLLFGIAHMNPIQFLYAVPVGLLLGWFYYKTRNFLVPVFLHTGINTLSILFTYIKIEHPLLKEFLQFGHNTNSILELPLLPIVISLFILMLSLYIVPKMK